MAKKQVAKEAVVADKVAEAAKVKADKEAMLAKVAIGTKETKEALQLAFAIAKIVKEAKANDGIFSANDLMLLTALFPSIGPAVDGLGKIPSELKDLDSEETKDLLKFTAAHLGGMFASEEMVAKVEAGLELALAINKMIKVMS